MQCIKYRCCAGMYLSILIKCIKDLKLVFKYNTEHETLFFVFFKVFVFVWLDCYDST